MKDRMIGICKVGEKGQIVIPKDARDMFDIKTGDSIIILCDKEKGIALVKSDALTDMKTILDGEDKNDSHNNK